MRTTKQSGFSIVAVLLMLVVLGVLGFAGYTVYHRQHNKTNTIANTSTTSGNTTAQDVPAAPQISSTSDLDKAAVTLDQADTSSSSDSAALDSELQSF